MGRAYWDARMDWHHTITGSIPVRSTFYIFSIELTLQLLPNVTIVTSGNIILKNG